MQICFEAESAKKKAVSEKLLTKTSDFLSAERCPSQSGSILLALFTRVLSGIYVLSGRWAETGNLHDKRFVIGFCEVVLCGWFGVETGCW
jgi:hypothetical protein